MARIVAGIGSSHVPAIGAAIDNGKTEEPYWKRVFSGFEKSQEWMRETKPDVAIIVYNDHASAFSVDRFRPSRSAARRNSHRPTKAGARGRCRSCKVIRR